MIMSNRRMMHTVKICFKSVLPTSLWANLWANAVFRGISQKTKIRNPSFCKELRILLEKADKISGFMFEIHERGGILESFDEKLWVTTIEQVKVHHDGRMVFVFKSGTEVTR